MVRAHGVTVLALGALCGCGLSWPRFPLVRTGPPSSGQLAPPATACESSGWLLAAPALATGTVSAFLGWGAVRVHQPGVALYRHDALAHEQVGDGPLALLDALPASRDAPWLRQQLAPLGALARRRAVTWSLAGASALLTFLVGPAVALRYSDGDPSTTHPGEVAGFATMGLGLGLAIAAWIVYPTPPQVADEDNREQLAMSDEAAAALHAAVAAHNLEVRQRCHARAQTGAP